MTDNIIGLAVLLILLLIIVYMVKITYHIYVTKIIYDMVTELNTKNRSRCIFFIDKNNTGIIPFRHYIEQIIEEFIGMNYVLDLNDSYGFQKILKSIIDDNIQKIDICIESYGGSVFDNDIIVKNLLDYDGRIETYIPTYAYSAASIISLCGHVINMGNSAVLGPTDPIDNINNVRLSVQSLIKVKTLHYDKIDCNMLAQILDSEKAYDENYKLLGQIFSRHIENCISGKIIFKKKMCKLFGSGILSHGSPFTKKFLLKKGLLIGNNNIEQCCTILKYIKKIY